MQIPLLVTNIDSSHGGWSCRNALSQVSRAIRRIRSRRPPVTRRSDVGSVTKRLCLCLPQSHWFPLDRRFHGGVLLLLEATGIQHPVDSDRPNGSGDRKTPWLPRRRLDDVLRNWVVVLGPGSVMRTSAICRLLPSTTTNRRPAIPSCPFMRPATVPPGASRSKAKCPVL